MAILSTLPYTAAHLMGDPEASNYRGGEPEVVLAESYLRHNGKTAYWAERTPEEQELLE